MCLYTSVYGVLVLVRTKNESIPSRVDFHEHFGTVQNIFEGNVTQNLNVHIHLFNVSGNN